MSKSLKQEWVEKIFMRLHGRFGNAFFDKFRIGQLNANGEDIGILNAKEVWAQGLGHLTADRIKRGLDTMFQHPPSMDEFVMACRPVPQSLVDHKALPKPKADPAKVQQSIDNLYKTLNIKKISQK